MIDLLCSRITTKLYWSIYGVMCCAVSVLAIAPQVALAQQVCGTPGKDGAATSLGGVFNTYYPGSGTAAGTTISVGARQSGGGSDIAAGDLILIMQMQDGSTATFSNTSANVGGMDGSAGKYEYAKVASVSGGTLTLTKPLTHTYTQAPGTINHRTFQVVRVPQYTSASLTSGITALPWNGRSGGIVAIDVAGTLNFNNQSIDVTGKGFRGGGSKDVAYWYHGSPVYIDQTVPFIYAGTYEGTNNDYPNKRLAAFKGEGTAGTPRLLYNGTTLLPDAGADGYSGGDLGRGAPGNAGGGGIVGGELTSTKIPGHDAGGGGGGNIGAGGVGGDTWQPQSGRWPNGGFGGNGITASTDRIILGGGGGAGITTNSAFRLGLTIADGIINGGPGGGIVLVRTGTIAGSGSILAKGIAGTNGYNGTPDNDTDAGGGGGAGGAVFVAAGAGSFAGLNIQVTGGNGADSTYREHGPGGGGGGGLIAYGGGAVGAPNGTITGGQAGLDIHSTRDPSYVSGHYGSTPGTGGAINSNLTYSTCKRANVLLVKRITAINGQAITSFVDNPDSLNDNDPNWPSNSYLRGAIDGGKVQPGDEIEYTIYYLNTGDNAAKDVRICDRLNNNLIFQPQFDLANSATVDKGINLVVGNSSPEYLTNTSNDDRGFLSTSSTLPTKCNLSGNTSANLSDNVVVVDVADSINSLPGSIAPGSPNNSYGYVRFKTKVNLIANPPTLVIPLAD
jgi:uncharacterized repeat protein (TIGR01451 family)